MKIVGDQLIVTCDALISGEFGINLSSLSWGSSNPTSGTTHGSQAVFDLPAGDTFYMFFHIDGCSWYVLDENGEKQITGWVLDFVDGPFPVTTGVTTMTVENADGTICDNAPLGFLDNLTAGEYTVTLLYNGDFVAAKTVTVERGATTEVDFGTISFRLADITTYES